MVRRVNYSDLEAFITIARTRSFRKAATERGVSGPAMSQALRNLEEQLGVRLLNRTTRSIALTEAGEALLARASHAFEDIGDALEHVQSLQGEVAGRIRINAPAPATRFILAPLVEDFIKQHPAVSFELISDASFVDVVGEGFDAGVRFACDIPKDMIAIPIGAPLHFVILGSPSYFEQHGVPQHPLDIMEHECILFRFPGGSLYEWTFSKGKEEYEFIPEGRYTLNDSHVMISAACAGVGLIRALVDYAQEEIHTGKLVQVLNEWTPAVDQWSLYVPSRKQMPAALRAFIDFIKSRNGVGV
ncbi:HTH-type transcriptional regulator PgrR [Thalassocella blandensis]|nr:HTH-type transcriptional regulator PgrR [Thalassocella blandensis]